MKMIIAGSRSITDYELVERVMKHAIDRLGAPTIVISGMAKGVDTLGVQWALKNGLNESSIIKMPVTPEEWRIDPYNAGHRRNMDMAEIADSCVIIHDGVHMNKSGSIHMKKTCERMGIPLYYWNVLERARFNETSFI